MTSSPFLTLILARSPLSRRLPSPTLRTLPRLGFSLAVSGRTMPDLVLVSASTRLTSSLSPRGRSLAMGGSSFFTGIDVLCPLLFVLGPLSFAKDQGQMTKDDL